ncbi:MAG: creatininase family protein [Lentisphaerae bacterium]|nr:creatininase family protein [Lentisphaerota bacterium]
MSVLFAEKSWPQIKEYIDQNALVILPFGTLEEHGLHLPVNVDAVIAEQVAIRVAEAVQERYPTLVMPVAWAGYSIRKMNKWPGVISIRSEILVEAWFDILASLVKMGFKKLLCINGHGQNPEMIKLAARRISDEFDVHVVTSNSWGLAAETMKQIRKSEMGGCYHGGEYETSLMLYFTDLVDMRKATNEDIMKYRSDFYPGDMFGSATGGTFLSTWYVQESRTGVYGDPTEATKETGRLLVEGMVRNYAKLIDEYMNLK